MNNYKTLSPEKLRILREAKKFRAEYMPETVGASQTPTVDADDAHFGHFGSLVFLPLKREQEV